MVKKEEPRLSDPAHAIGRVIATQDQPCNAKMACFRSRRKDLKFVSVTPSLEMFIEAKFPNRDEMFLNKDERRNDGLTNMQDSDKGHLVEVE